MGELEIVAVPALSDNYIWLLHDPDSGETVVVDPGEATPVIKACDARGWTPSQLWITHWHPDHTGGNAALKDRYALTVAGPRAEAAKIPTLDRLLSEGDALSIGAYSATVLETPGHTAGHVVFHLGTAGVLLSGDTLFAMGCGRLFEGTAEQMWDAMQRFSAMPGETRVYCGHEYTQSNGRFALSVEPDNDAVVQRMSGIDAARASGEITLPTTIALECATNPFMRAKGAAALSALRSAKDSFRGA